MKLTEKSKERWSIVFLASLFILSFPAALFIVLYCHKIVHRLLGTERAEIQAAPIAPTVSVGYQIDWRDTYASAERMSQFDWEPVPGMRLILTPVEQFERQVYHVNRDILRRFEDFALVPFEPMDYSKPIWIRTPVSMLIGRH